MICKIEIAADTVTLYKQEACLAAGTYYRFLGSRPSEQQKKKLSLKCGTRGREFMWLAPYEPWVKRLVDGIMDVVPTSNYEPDWNMIGLRKEQVREWQQWLVKECYNYLRNGLPYKKGWVAPFGAGKTLGGLMIGQYFEPGEVAVLCARYLHETWKSEAVKWGMPVPLMSTYESCHKLPASVKCLIIDETLAAYKNPDTRRSQRVTALAERCEVVLGFTGTVSGGAGPIDMRWLRAVNPGCVPADEKAWQFAFGLDTALKDVGPNKAYITTKWDKVALARFTNPFLNTIDIEAIRQDMPEVTFQYIACPKPEQYESIKAGAGTTSGTHKRLAQVLQSTDGFIYNDSDQPVRIVSEKLRIVQEWVEALGEPVVLVSNWTDCINQLSEMFADRRPAVLAGGTSDPGAEITRFKTGQTDLLIANAGFSRGMNLQATCRIIGFVSIGTKPDDLAQMIARVARPGQKAAVQIVFFCCDDTLDMHRIECVRAHQECNSEIIEKLLEEEMLRC